MTVQSHNTQLHIDLLYLLYIAYKALTIASTLPKPLGTPCSNNCKKLASNAKISLSHVGQKHMHDMKYAVNGKRRKMQGNDAVNCQPSSAS